MVAFFFFVFLLIKSTAGVQSRSDVVGSELTSNEGDWGSWAGYEYCAEGQWANTIEFKSESDQGDVTDDTAGNGVRLFCKTPTSSQEYTYETGAGKDWGTWYAMDPDACPLGSWLIGFRTTVESKCTGFLCVQDDTALNCIQMKCSDGTILKPLDCRNWGDGYPSSFSQCSNGYICGLNEKFEENSNTPDETGLNGVKFRCCDYTDSPTPAPTFSPTITPTGSPSQPPTIVPSSPPTNVPTFAPSEGPSAAPTIQPTLEKDGEANIIHHTTTDWTPLYVVLGIIVLLAIIGISFFLWYKKRKQVNQVNAIGIPPNSPISENIGSDILVAQALATQEGGVTNTTNGTNVTNGTTATTTGGQYNIDRVVPDENDDDDDDEELFVQ